MGVCQIGPHTRRRRARVSQASFYGRLPNRSAGILSQNGLALRQARLVAATAVHMSSVQGTEPSDLTTKAITGALRAYAFVDKSDGSVPWILDIWTAEAATRRACRRASPFCDKIPADLFGIYSEFI